MITASSNKLCWERTGSSWGVRAARHARRAQAWPSDMPRPPSHALSAVSVQAPPASALPVLDLRRAACVLSIQGTGRQAVKLLEARLQKTQAK